MTGHDTGWGPVLVFFKKTAQLVSGTLNKMRRNNYFYTAVITPLNLVLDIF